MIIWIASLPRAGNTFFRLLLHHYCGIETHSFYNDPIFIRKGVAEILGHVKLPKKLGAFVSAHQAVAGDYKFIKTHHYPNALPGKCQTAVCIIRDPRDAAVSLAHYKNWKKRVPFQKALGIVVRRYNWSAYLSAWRVIENSSVVKYEDMLREPQKVVERVVETLGIDLPIVTSTPLVPFRKLHRKLPEFFRRGKANVWQDVLSKEQEAIILKRHGPMMKEMGYL